MASCKTQPGPLRSTPILGVGHVFVLQAARGKHAHVLEIFLALKKTGACYTG